MCGDSVAAPSAELLSGKGVAGRSTGIRARRREDKPGTKGRVCRPSFFVAPSLAQNEMNTWVGQRQTRAFVCSAREICRSAAAS